MPALMTTTHFLRHPKTSFLWRSLMCLWLYLTTTAFCQDKVIIVVDYDFGQQLGGVLKIQSCLAEIQDGIKTNVGNRGQCIEHTTFEFQELSVDDYIGSVRLELQPDRAYQICVLAEDLAGLAGLYINCETVESATNMRLSFPNENLVAWKPEPNLVPACLLTGISLSEQLKRQMTEIDLPPVPEETATSDTKEPTAKLTTTTLPQLLDSLTKLGFIDKDCKQQIDSQSLAIESVITLVSDFFISK